MLRASLGAFAVVFCVLSTSAFAAPGHKQIVIRWSNSIDVKTLNDSISRLCITGDDSVSLKVTHFNFLHYSLRFTIEERQVESYVMLDRLWSQVFKAAGGLAVESTSTFDSAIVAWRRALANADVALGTFRAGFAGHAALSDSERQAIVDNTLQIGKQPLDNVEALRRSALDAAATSGDYDLYERVLTQHVAVVARLNAFLKAADLVKNGEVYVVGKKKAGTVVTFSITATDAQQQTTGEPFQSSYFVRSTRPLVLHVGYAGSGLQDAQFEKVRSANGADLFLSTKSDDKTASLVTFMSYEVWKFGPTGELGIHATLGTGFQRPGEALFFGGGVRLTRFVISVGVSGTGVREGRNRVLESIAGAAGQRELFTAVATHQKWAPFTAVSIRVF